MSSSSLRCLTTILRTLPILAIAFSEAHAAIRYFDRSYALVIGVDRYAHENWPKLSYGQKDALAMEEFLEGQGYNVWTLLGGDATRENILSTISDEIAPRLSGRDRVVVFFSGHGETREVGWRDYGYIIPYDGTDRFSTWISMAEMREVSVQLQKARHQLFLFDSCYGGSIGEKARDLPEIDYPPRYLDKISSNRARQFLTAGGKNERVLAGGPHGYSYFTGHLLAGLEGEADRDEDTIVTMSELSGYLLSAANNWDHTPNWGVLREHDAGEFWFRVDGNRETPTGFKPAQYPALSVPPDSPWIFKSPLGSDERRPQTLTHPQGPIDSLRRIAEIGEVREAALYEMGVFHYSQIADWNDDNVLWLQDNVPSFNNLKKDRLKNAIDCLRQRQPAPGRQIPRELARQCGTSKNSDG